MDGHDVIEWAFTKIDALWVPTVAVIALAALFLVIPRVFRRLRRGDATMADRVAATVVLVGLVGAGALLFTPMSDGPYRCSPVAYGSQGRKTVLPDGSEDPVSTQTQYGVDQGTVAHGRREGICNDAARARGMTAVAVVGASAVLGAGITFIFGSSPAGRTPGPAGPARRRSLASS